MIIKNAIDKNEYPNFWGKENFSSSRKYAVPHDKPNAKP